MAIADVDTGARTTVLGTVGLTVLTLVTVGAFGPLFAEPGLTRELVVMAFVAHLLALGLRWVRWPIWAALPVQALVIVVLVATVQHPDSLAAGFLPTGDTWSLLRDDLRVVWEQFPTALVPVPGDSPFSVAALGAIGFVALTADAFAFRAHGRLESIAPAAVTFVVVSAVGREEGRVLTAAIWVGAALLALVLLRIGDDDGRVWIGRRGPSVLARRTSGAFMVVLLATASAAWLAPRLPGAGEDALIDTRNSPNEVTQVLSPLVDIRSRLTNRGTTLLFTVEADQEAYWRLTGLPRFDGRTWSLPDRRLAEAGADLRAGLASGPFIDQTIEIRALGGNLVPAAFTPVAAGPSAGNVSSDDIELYFADDTSTLVVTGGGLRRGMLVDVVSQSPEPDPGVLRAAGVSSPPAAEYLSLPDGFPTEFAQLARSVTAGAPTPYDQALALQTWFRTEFSYSLDVPPGHGEDAIADFLERRSGYCEQFAGTFAAFARTLGLPARVAVGFSPGDLGSSGRYEVRGRHAHAWPEVWFDGIGWVLFEPTPGRGAPRADRWTGVPPEQAESESTEPGGETSTTTTLPATTLPGEQATVPPPAQSATTTTQAPGAGAASSGPRGTDGTLVFLAVLAAIVGWVTLMPVVVRSLVRSRRRTPAARVLAAWQAASRSLADTGAKAHPGDTPHEHARRAARLTGLDPGSLYELAHHATLAVYGTREPDDRTARRSEDLRSYVESSTRDMLPWATRLRARVDPLMVASRS